ncbi:MAG: hypothetical protein M1837_005728 [Sclerophora amabilis]|nr:MAG: hypothetical protein M1837_005728 [Sclerophora amabilis]
MADSMCGPSNALKHIQQHTSVDRSLQHDRLQSRHGSSQGFRSSPGPNAGVLDPEFEAFQHGVFHHPPPQEVQRRLPPGPSHFSNEALSHSVDSTAWAVDFQKLHLSDGSRTAFQMQQSTNPDLRADWKHFGSESYQASENQSTEGPEVPFNRQHNFANSNMGGTYGSSLYQGMSGGPSYLETSSNPVQQPDEGFDAEAFERAFDFARSELQHREKELAQQENLEIGNDVLINESAERLIGEVFVEGQERIGADLIADKLEAQPQNARDDHDELAKTAGNLLESVRNNQTQKFQESTFLALMRRLRDKEATVDGDRIIEACASLFTLHDRD